MCANVYRLFTSEHEKVPLLRLLKRERGAHTYTMFKFGTTECASLSLSPLTLAISCVINRAAADWLKMQMASEESRAWENAAGEDEDAGARAKTGSL